MLVLKGEGVMNKRASKTRRGELQFRSFTELAAATQRQHRELGLARPWAQGPQPARPAPPAGQAVQGG
jgi:hypothetical protein